MAHRDSAIAADHTAVHFCSQADNCHVQLTAYPSDRQKGKVREPTNCLLQLQPHGIRGICISHAHHPVYQQQSLAACACSQFCHCPLRMISKPLAVMHHNLTACTCVWSPPDRCHPFASSGLPMPSDTLQYQRTMQFLNLRY